MTRSAGALRAPLSARPFRQVAIGHALSATAQSLPVVALAVYVYERTQSSAWVALAASVRLLPPVAFSALAGAVGDRHDRRRVLLACNASAAVATAVLAGLAAAGASVPLVMAMAFAAASITTADYPAVVASTPALVAPHDLVAANTVVSTVESAAFMIGPGVGGLLLARYPPWVVFAAGALMFAVAALGIGRAGRWNGRARSADKDRTVRGQLVTGWRACGGAAARPVVLVLLATELLYGCTVVLLVLVADDPARAGLLHASFAGGVLAAVLFAGPLSRRRRPVTVIAVSALASGLPVAMLALSHAPLPAYALLAVAGVASVVVEVHARSLLQQVVGDDVMAGVFGLVDSLACLAILGGSILTPALAGAVGIVPALIIVGGALPALAILPLARNRPSVQDLTTVR